MAASLRELEGTWEEIAAHAQELAGHRVRLTVLSEESGQAAAYRPASGRPLLRHAGAWEGDDLEERLAEAVATRAPADF